MCIFFYFVVGFFRFIFCLVLLFLHFLVANIDTNRRTNWKNHIHENADENTVKRMDGITFTSLRLFMYAVLLFLLRPKKNVPKSRGPLFITG